MIALHAPSNKETDAVAVQDTPSPHLGPAGQIGDDPDHLDNEPSTSTADS
jgi:hypothetical protein